MILPAIAIAMALSLDAFTASFAYGSNRIKIPLRSAQIINLICTGTTGLSLLLGRLLQQWIPTGLALAFSCAILFTLGLIKLLDCLTKSIIRKHSSLQKELHFSLCNFRFILTLYADPEKADRDRSQTLEPAEAASLAVALSLDGIAVGIGAALAGIHFWPLVISSLVTNTVGIALGAAIGMRIATRTSFNLSWLGGVILMGMAMIKLVV